MKDYYYILGIRKDASLEEIKKAYRKLSQKFHPDKNDGDAFFAERFKDINEAHETLSVAEKREEYDLNFSRNSAQGFQNGSNFVPVIDYFKVNKNEFEYDERITFSWRSVNSTNVILDPFGQVEAIGQKTYQIKDLKHMNLSFTLIAENSNIDRKVESTVTIKNKTYQEFYNIVLSDLGKLKTKNEESIQDKEKEFFFKERIKALEKRVSKNRRPLIIVTVIAIALVTFSFIFSNNVLQTRYDGKIAKLNQNIVDLKKINSSLLSASSERLKSKERSLDSLKVINNSQNESLLELQKKLSYYMNTENNRQIVKRQAEIERNRTTRTLPRNVTIKNTQEVELLNFHWDWYGDDTYHITKLSIMNKTNSTVTQVKYSWSIFDTQGRPINSGSGVIPYFNQTTSIAPGSSKEIYFHNSDAHKTDAQTLLLTIDQVVTQ